MGIAYVSNEMIPDRCTKPDGFSHIVLNRGHRGGEDETDSHSDRHILTHGLRPYSTRRSACAGTEAKGGLAELARVFAAMDQQDDSSEYLALLLEFEACILEAWENEGNEFEKEFTDEETVVLVMHTVSTFMMGIMFQLDYEQEDGVEFERQQYQLLILSVDFCRGDVD